MLVTTYNNKGHRIIKHLPYDKVIEMKLDWINNFLTVQRFAEYYNISYFSAQRIAQIKFN
jgi:hypothetical protein